MNIILFLSTKMCLYGQFSPYLQLERVSFLCTWFHFSCVKIFLMTGVAMWCVMSDAIHNYNSNNRYRGKRMTRNIREIDIFGYNT